jgi:hypothetical protein
MLVRRFAMAACGFVLAGAPMLACVLLPACVTGAHAEQETGQRQKLDWQSWSPENFARAKAEGRFVILDLEAVWCHWCHVMESTTYQDPKVVELLKSKFITVRVDQDANPDLSNRYGDWGWPATIVFAADGSEIAKRRVHPSAHTTRSLPQSTHFCRLSYVRRWRSGALKATTKPAAGGEASTNSSTPTAWTGTWLSPSEAARPPPGACAKRFPPR